MCFSALHRAFPSIVYEQPFSFRKHTTVGIGGTAPLGVYPKSAEELVKILVFLRSEKIPYFILGNGSNILVSDTGFQGVAICTRKMNDVHIGCDGQSIEAECGASVAQILAFAAKNGLDGLAFLAGIPATMGGILYMNAGAQGQYIESVLQNAEIFLEGKRTYLTAQDCRYSYKESRFMHEDAVILKCVLRCSVSAPEMILKSYREILLKRNMLPKGKSLGCIFKNLPGVSAGQLIEKCGLKGLRCGGAAVSAKHANFIINNSGATADEYKALIYQVKQRVFSETGMVLEEEIRYIGEFADASDG